MENKQCKWCDNKAASRGVCAKHYARAKLCVESGASWEAVLAGDEPQPGKRGRPVKTGSASWLTEKYDELSRDVTKAIALIELGNTDEAKRVLIGDWKGTATIAESIQCKVEKGAENCEMSNFVANMTENGKKSHE